MRVQFTAPPQLADPATLEALFGHVRQQFGMALHFHARAARPRVMLMVSQHGHCLNDLLFRVRSGQLRDRRRRAWCPTTPTHAELVRGYGIPFHHLPLAAGADAQAKQRAGGARAGADRAASASTSSCWRATCRSCRPSCARSWPGRAINIHHSFLPSFKGARPYCQAHARGVKLIGATAHYVTADLDEGPIIEQDVARVDHSDSTDEMTAAGRDVECLVLARAVRWHAEHRVLLNGHKTVVFR